MCSVDKVNNSVNKYLFNMDFVDNLKIKTHVIRIQFFGS